jgi:hypothetical protein
MITNKLPAAKAAYVDSYLRRASLGLLTTPEFQLKLLEGAIKGKKIFDTLWDNNYEVQQQLLWHEISQEVEVWQNEGNLEMLLTRGRRLAVKLKEEKALHVRALKIYCQILEISRRKNLADSQQFLAVEWGEPEHSIREGKSSVLSIHADPSARMYEYPVSFDYWDDCKIASEEERGCSMSTEIDEATQPGSVQWSKKKQQRLAKPGIGDLGWDGLKIKLIQENEDEVKYEDGRRLTVDSFKGDFHEPIQWKVGDKTCTALNVNDIRSKNKVMIEGPFEKRRMAYRWKHYYGFLTAKGVLIYFGQEKNNEIDFKKAVDFRGNSITVSKDDQLRFTVYAAGRNWLLRFATKKEFSDWHAAIKIFSRSLPNSP